MLVKWNRTVGLDERRHSEDTKEEQHLQMYQLERDHPPVCARQGVLCGPPPPSPRDCMKSKLDSRAADRGQSRSLPCETSSSNVLNTDSL